MDEAGTSSKRRIFAWLQGTGDKMVTEEVRNVLGFIALPNRL